MTFSGAQIIDLMLLVVDVVKGMQTQTAECLVIGEITCQKMIVVLNKVDLLPSDKKLQQIDRVSLSRKTPAILLSGVWNPCLDYFTLETPILTKADGSVLTLLLSLTWN